VRFTLSVAIHFCYVTLLVFLLAVALFQCLPTMAPAVRIVLGLLHGTFAVARINTGAQYGMGRFYLPATSVARSGPRS
jgi:hypothetical protein